MADYAHPEVLVGTDWVAAHAKDPNVRVVEVDVDTKAFDEGHVPGALAWAWNTQLCDTLRRDILSRQQFEELMSASGVQPDTTLVIYGDNNNWFAAWALWQAKIYGHKDVRLMNGGRKKWLSEGRELSHEVAAVERTRYQAKPPDLSLRAPGIWPPRWQVSGKPGGARISPVNSCGLLTSTSAAVRFADASSTCGSNARSERSAGFA